MKASAQILLLGAGLLLAHPRTSAAAAQPPSAQVHWSFVAPKRLKISEVKNLGWVRNPIDHFVLARLEREALTPSLEADRRTLIRRLSLDLLGLPPTIEEVRAFVADERPDAYALLVDRLLASPHFGERWGRHWLDLARYADSDGYEKDTARPYAYLYRDWVIQAVNDDRPFDQFTVEQLAGDLLPNASQEQKIATGFHRNTLTNKEGGVDQEEFRCKATVDRVSTTSTVWLGLTVGCAECHTHKYDPITQWEFYQLYAFFNNASELDLPAPRPAELAAYQKEKQPWDRERARISAELAAYLRTEIASHQAAWEQAVQLPPERWAVLSPAKASSSGGATLKIESDRSIQASGQAPATDTYTVEVEGEWRNVTGFRLEILDDPAPGKGPGRSKNNNLVVSEFKVKVENAAALASGSSASPAVSPTVIEVPLQNASADHAPKDWPVKGAIDGDTKTGWAIDPQFDRRHVAVFETREDLAVPTGAKLIFQIDQQYGSQHTVGRFRLSATSSPHPLKAHLMPDAVVRILSGPDSQREEKDIVELAKYYRDEVDPRARQLDRQLAEHTRKEPKFPETKAQTLAENEKPRETRIHVRGDFLRRGEAVAPGTPAVLHSFEPGRENPNRLDLARWLFDPANPLTARVTVNHVWYRLFGRGLVSTLDDFGTRGEKPSHPELLDWLATELPRLGWSRKQLIKLIVTSATYRQSSHPRADLAERDPNNLLLARQNRIRLEAESIRDAFLKVSGLLHPALGGPTIRPPLPADIAALGYANSVKWKESEGAERYRRGLYIHFQRTVPYPMLMTFDAPDSNVACTRRERSNTPLQALTLLNDPVFFECAQALGKRAARHPTAPPLELIKLSFENCLSREPTEEELVLLGELYDNYAQALRTTPENAAKIYGRAETTAAQRLETAALVGVARSILNLDEFVTRE